jgi:sterol desaturase/sphingolipid hydroxylase (fatty acid hydroxylase superfamily)
MADAEHHAVEPTGRKSATRGVIIFTVALALVMIFPIFAIGNRVEPFVLGLPFSMFWVVFWITVEFLGLVAFFVYEHGREGDA